jgi:serine/threonine-protein kinase
MTEKILSEGELLDGKYRIVGSIGAGAWGHVYEGVNERIDRRVAIKVMHIEYAEKPDMRGRFEREARAATRIESPHVIHVFDMGFLGDGRPYIVMELLKGENLGARIHRDGPLPLERVAVIGVQALRGLSDAHAAGILHRDIKPDNIVLTRAKHGGDVVKIVDFGISKVAHAGGVPSNMTQTSQLLGSPVYMSPEQCRGVRNMDQRSDLYSLGVALFEAATGKLPFDAENFNELMFKIALEDAPDARTFKPDLDPDFALVLRRALARDPDARFQTAGEFELGIVQWGEAHNLASDDWRRVSTTTGARDARVVTEGSGVYVPPTPPRPAGPGVATTNRPVTTPHPPAEPSHQPDLAHADTARPIPASPEPLPKRPARTIALLGAAIAVAGVLVWRPWSPRPTGMPEPEVRSAAASAENTDMAARGQRKAHADTDSEGRGPKEAQEPAQAKEDEAQAKPTAAAKAGSAAPTTTASPAPDRASDGKPRAGRGPRAPQRDHAAVRGPGRAAAAASAAASANKAAAPAPSSAPDTVDGRTIRTQF